MIALLWLLRAILALPFKSKRQLEAENGALRHQVIVAPGARAGPSDEPRSAGSGPALPLVSSNFESPRDCSAGDGHSLASGRVSLLLALEVAPAGRAAGH
jgi:hypothetical protein